MVNDPWYDRVCDPTTDAAELAQIAAHRPDLRAHVASHPQAYPELLAWLRDQGDPHVAAIVDSRVHASAVPSSGAPAYAYPVADAAGTSTPHVPTSMAPGHAEAAYDGWASPAHEVSVETSATPPRRRKGIVIAGVAAGLALVLGGGAFAVSEFIGGKFKPAASPEQAAERLVDAVAAKDLLGIAGIMSPAETGALRDVVADSSTSSGSVGSSVKQAARALDVLKISVEGVKTRVVDLQDGLVRVELTDGTLTVDGDPAKLADLVLENLGSLPMTDLGSVDREETRDAIVDQLAGELPYRVDLGRIAAEEDVPVFVMAVEEGGGWYVSPYLTLGEIAYLDSGTDARRGTMLGAGEGAGGETPVEAADALVRAAARGDMRGLVAGLSLAERRVLSVYADTSRLDIDDIVVHGTFSQIEAGPRRALVVPDDLSLVADSYDGRTTVTFDGVCVDVDLSYDGYGRLCLDKAPLVSDLGLGGAAFVMVKEGDEWFLAPTESVVRAVSLTQAAASSLEKSGTRLDAAWVEREAGRLVDHLGVDNPLLDLPVLSDLRYFYY